MKVALDGAGWCLSELILPVDPKVKCLVPECRPYNHPHVKTKPLLWGSGYTCQHLEYCYATYGPYSCLR